MPIRSGSRGAAFAPGAMAASAIAMRPAASPNWEKRSSPRTARGVHVIGGHEVVDLGRHLRPERRGVEAVDALDR